MAELTRANDNLPDDIAFALQYLKSGGLGEVVMAADAAYRSQTPKVQSSPDVILALCILAQAGIDAGRLALEKAK